MWKQPLVGCTLLQGASRCCVDVYTGQELSEHDKNISPAFVAAFTGSKDAFLYLRMLSTHSMFSLAMCKKAWLRSLQCESNFSSLLGPHFPLQFTACGYLVTLKEILELSGLLKSPRYAAQIQHYFHLWQSSY